MVSCLGAGRGTLVMHQVGGKAGRALEGQLHKIVAVNLAQRCKVTLQLCMLCVVKCHWSIENIDDGCKAEGRDKTCNASLQRVLCMQHVKP